MAIEKMAFSPSNLWKDTASFPNKQDETKNRDMLNSGHMQTKEFINDLIDQLESTTEDACGSSLIGAYAIEGLKNEDESDAETVQQQIEALKKLYDSIEASEGEDVETLTTSLETLDTKVEGYNTALTTKIETADTTLDTKIDTSVATLNSSIDLKANASDVYTKTATDTLLDAKANESNVYSKSDVDTKLSGKADSTSVYTTTAINEKVDMTNGAIATINEMANAGGNITLSGGTGISISVDTTNKRIIFNATGEAQPGAHASSHTNIGTDPIDSRYLLYGVETLESVISDIASDVSDNADEISDIKDGTTKVGSATSADSATNATKLNDHADTYFATASSVSDITDGTTSVGNATKLNGQSASYYATSTALTNVKKANASTITLLSTDWQEVSEVQTLEYALSWVTANDVLVVDLIPSDDEETRESELQAWSKVYSVTTESGKIVFKASEEIDTDLTITFVLGGVLNG